MHGEISARVAPLGSPTTRFLPWSFLLLGIGIRLVRYGLRFPLWGDELLLTSNFLDRSFADLLRPLDYHQVAPVLFLWLELAATRLLGFTEYSLRLVPFAFGIGSLVLFYWIAMRSFGHTAALLGVAIFAVATYVVRYNAEAKPYSADACASLALVAIALRWWYEPNRPRWLWLLAAVAPLAVLLSYPSIFVIGGLSVALFVTLVRQRPPRSGIPFLVFALLSGLSLALSLKLSIGPQTAAEGHVMRDYWANAFPPNSWTEWPRWLLGTHTGEMFAYPVGGENGGGAIQFGLFAIGLWALYRGRLHPLALAITAIFALALVAATLKRYPYGGHPRLMQYAAPLICLCMGAGIARLLEAMRHDRLRRWTFHATLIGFALLGAGQIARDLVHPYRDEHERVYRDMARWFWDQQKQVEADVTCIDTAFQVEPFPENRHKMPWVAYRCNRRIYGAFGERTPPQDHSSRRPLRCVVYHQADVQPDESRLQSWLAEMNERYELVDHRSYRWSRDVPRAREVYDVYEFIVRGESRNARREGNPGKFGRGGKAMATGTGTRDQRL
jgi:hypothetical protein